MSAAKSATFVVTSLLLGFFAFSFQMVPGSSLPHNDRMGEWNRAKVRAACIEALDRLDHPDLPRYPSDFVTVPGEERATEMTAALHCYVVTRREAVCDADNRAYIVDYIVQYYGLMDAMLASAKKKDPGQLDTMRAFWNSRRNQQISAAIDAAIRDGKLNKADFGRTAPAALKAALDQNAKAADRCVHPTAAKPGPQLTYRP